MRSCGDCGRCDAAGDSKIKWRIDLHQCRYRESGVIAIVSSDDAAFFWIGNTFLDAILRSQPRQSELDGAHVAKRQVEPEVVVPVDAVSQLRLKLARRRESLPVGELGLERLVRGLGREVVVRASLTKLSSIA